GEAGLPDGAGGAGVDGRFAGREVRDGFERAVARIGGAGDALGFVLHDRRSGGAVDRRIAPARAVGRGDDPLRAVGVGDEAGLADRFADIRGEGDLRGIDGGGGGAQVVAAD